MTSRIACMFLDGFDVKVYGAEKVVCAAATLESTSLVTRRELFRQPNILWDSI